MTISEFKFFYYNGFIAKIIIEFKFTLHNLGSERIKV